MLDIKFIRENPDLVQKGAESKGYKVDIAGLLKLDSRRRELQTKADAVRQDRNQLAAELKQGKPTQVEISKGRHLKEELAKLEDSLASLEEEFFAELKKVPNTPLPHVPAGASEAENVVEKTVGKKPEFSFQPKNHWEIALERGWLDKERAAKVAGSRFVYIKGDLVRLHFALMQWALDQLTNETILQKIIDKNQLKVTAKPFVPVMPPAVIRTEVYEATGRLNAEEQTYKLADDDLWLNASAEHSMAPMHKDEILPEADLPLRYAGYATSFRREAGTYGKDTEGMFRLHQFDKLEMESFTTPKDGFEEHKFMIAIQEHLMQQLGLPYNVVQKCTADIGGPNAAGVDLDAWLPGQGKFRETHTADYITDYQTRRLQIRLRRDDGLVELAHTNDATALSMRPLIAIIENYQNQDGKVRVPDVLQAYLGGQKLI